MAATSITCTLAEGACRAGGSLSWRDVICMAEATLCFLTAYMYNACLIVLLVDQPLCNIKGPRFVDVASNWLACS